MVDNEQKKGGTIRDKHEWARMGNNKWEQAKISNYMEENATTNEKEQEEEKRRARKKEKIYQSTSNKNKQEQAEILHEEKNWKITHLFIMLQ